MIFMNDSVIRPAFILIISFTLLLAGSIIFLSFDNKNEDKPYLDHNYTGESSLKKENYLVTDIEIYYSIKNVSFYLDLLPESSSNIIEAEWKLSYDNRTYNDPEISITPIKNNEILSIFINISYSPKLPVFSFSNFSLGINPTYSNYSFICKSGTSRLDLFFQDMNFKDFNIETDGGRGYLRLIRGNIYNSFNISTDNGYFFPALDLAYFYTDIFISSKIGRLDLNFWDIIFEEGKGTFVNSEAYYIDIRWAQHTKLGNNVTIVIEAGYSCDFRMWCPFEETRFDLSGNAGEGIVNIDYPTGDYTQINDTHAVSSNINNTDLDLFIAKAKTSGGELYMRGLDCFKPRRFCREILPNYGIKREVTSIGEENISLASFSGDKIQLINETEKLNLQFNQSTEFSLDEISISWSLKYYKGNDYGEGDIALTAEVIVDNDTLKIYFRLDYEKDRIKPLFNSYNLEILIHQSFNVEILLS